MILILVGSPLSGKTTLLKKLQERNVKVFSADTFVNKIYEKNQPGYNSIKKYLSEEFVDFERVNKRKLANWITLDEKNINQLNEIIHPIIKSYLDDKDNFVAELPIITSSPIKFKYDKLILVKAEDNVINDRFRKSNFQNDFFISKIISDWKKSEKNIDFDYVVDTTSGINKIDVDNIIKLLNGK